MSFFFTTDKEKTESGRDFVHQLIHASNGNHHLSEGSVNLHAAVQSKSNYLKILKV
jgi:hypothetical protein